MNKLSPAAQQNLLSLLTLIGFFAIWELACIAFNVSSLILPKPSQIITVLITAEVKMAGTVPAPNQTTKIGTTATLGMLEKPTNSG